MEHIFDSSRHFTVPMKHSRVIRALLVVIASFGSSNVGVARTGNFGGRGVVLRKTSIAEYSQRDMYSITDGGEMPGILSLKPAMHLAYG